MSKKNFISSKVVLRSLTRAREQQESSQSLFILIIGIGIFLLGWFLVTHPEWILNNIVDRIAPLP